jgi:gamma-glutamyltranspeptidase / glutathione hydrolase
MSTARPTTRPLALGEHGMIATPHYLASISGLRVLMDGGNAVDAAIAAAAVLCVAYPHMDGIGGDLMALVWDAGAGALHGLNASGRSAAAASWQRYREMGHSTAPLYGGLSVTVPGTVDGWVQLHGRFGRRSLAELLEPAIGYAGGAPMTWTVADRLARNRDRLSAGQVYPSAPREGEPLAQPALRRTLESIAAAGADAFYRGPIGQSLAASARAAGGLLTAEDFAAHTSEWVTPIEGSFRGLQVLELPPSTQGVTALQIMGLLDGVRLPPHDPLDADRVHLGAEATKLAFADREVWLADPAFAPFSGDTLLSADALAARRASIDPARAATVAAPSIPPRGDTIFVAAADRDGNLVSLIESLYSPFGSGVLDPATGVLLHNRGAAFSLDPKSPNRLEPRKRPLHTLAPAMAFRGAEPWLAFGAMGGDGQPQTQAQVLGYMLDFGYDPQRAIEMPRWLSGVWDGDEPPHTLHVEARVPESVVEDLAQRGHPIVRCEPWDRRMGHAQGVLIDREGGFFQGAADPRGDGLALGW